MMDLGMLVSYLLQFVSMISDWVVCGMVIYVICSDIG